jgi:2-iminoacetate synthase ThiH
VSAAKQWFDQLIREQEQRVDAAEKAVEQFRDVVEPVGRRLVERTTLYQVPTPMTVLPENVLVGEP